MMERNREAARRPAATVGSNGFKRRYRTTTTDEEGGLVELQESVRLRERAVKRDRERERAVKRERERSSRNSKRRRAAAADVDDTSEESAEDEEDDDDDEYMETTTSAAAAGRILPPAVGSNHHLQHRKSFPLSSSSSSKILRASTVWRPGDEIISVSVPRKARSASTKRLHDWISSSGNNNGGGAEQILRHESGSPAPATAMAAPTSPSSSSRKRLKSSGKAKPPKSLPSKQNSSNPPEELEIEIAEVLYGLMTQSTQDPSSKNDEDSKEVDRLNANDSKKSSNNQAPVPNSNQHLQSVAPKRKKPRQPSENPDSGARSSHIPANLEKGHLPKSEISSPTLEKTIPGSTAEKGFETRSNSVNSQPESSTGMDSEELREIRDLAAAIEEDLKGRESPVVTSSNVAAATVKPNFMASEVEKHREHKLGIDLMAPPESEEEEEEKREKEDGGEPERGTETTTWRFVDVTFDLEESVAKARAAKDNKLQRQKSQKQEPQELALDDEVKREEVDPLTEKKSGQSKSSLPLPVPMAGWPGGLPPMGYVAPLQGVVPMDCSTVTPPPPPPPPPPIQPIFSQPRPKRCATHCYIAKNIQSVEQLMKMNPFWQDKGQHNLMSSNYSGKEKGSQAAHNNNNNSSDSSSAQRKQHQQQILIQQPLPPTNLLGPAFIFPFNQQQAAVAATSVQPSSIKSPPASGSMASSNPAPNATSAPVAGMSFNYPANEAQFLALLQNNAYPFPLAPHNIRGNPSQPMPPLFNGHFYPSSQMIHPSQLQQVQQHHQQQHQQQNSQPSNNHHMRSLQSIETDSGDDNNPSTTTTATTTDSARGSWPPANIYGRNFAMPIYPPQSFAVLAGGAAAPAVQSTNQSEKKPQNSFAMSFGPINGGSNYPNPTAQNHTGVDLAELPVSSSSVQVNKDHHMLHQMVAICRNNGIRVTEDSNSPSSIIVPKFPNGFPQNLAQSPQWTSSSARTTASTLKSNLQQQQQHSRAQISFGGNQKPASQGQSPPPSNSNRAPSPPMMSAGSPTTSSISKGAGESPRTSAKLSQGGPSLSAQQLLPRTSPSNLGAKPHQQQQVPKNMQQAQFFSNPFSQAQSPYSSGPTSSPGGLSMQRRGSENQPTQQGINHQARAIAKATTNVNVKGGGGLAASSHGIIQAAQFTAQLPAGFSYVPIPAAAVQVKAAEQKQPAA